MLKNILKILAIFILGIGGGIFADQILWPYFVERPLFYQYRLEKAPVYVTERKEITIQENTAIIEAVEKVEKAVVGIKTKTRGGKILEGSGLIVTSDGLVITLAELLPPGSTTDIFVDGTIEDFQILSRKPGENLALIKIEKENLPTCSFGDFQNLKLGERIFLVGVIFRKGKLQKIVNEGIIKYFDSDSIHTNIFEKYTLAGSSLFDIEGNVLGLNTIDSEGKVTAIPVSKIKEFIGF